MHLLRLTLILIGFLLSFPQNSRATGRTPTCELLLQATYENDGFEVLSIPAPDREVLEEILKTFEKGARSEPFVIAVSSPAGQQTIETFRLTDGHGINVSYDFFGPEQIAAKPDVFYLNYEQAEFLANYAQQVIDRVHLKFSPRKIRLMHLELFFIISQTVRASDWHTDHGNFAGQVVVIAAALGPGVRIKHKGQVIQASEGQAVLISTESGEKPATDHAAPEGALEFRISLQARFEFIGDEIKSVAVE